MKKKSLVLVIVLLCMASLLTAMAYTSAEVQAGYTVKVVNTDQALLALIPNADADNTAVIDNDGNLVLNFGKSEGGLQPDSTYVWENLVSVHNNARHIVKVTINNSAGGVVAVTDQNGNAVENQWLLPSWLFPSWPWSESLAGSELAAWSEAESLTGAVKPDCLWPKPPWGSTWPCWSLPLTFTVTVPADADTGTDDFSGKIIVTAEKVEFTL